MKRIFAPIVAFLSLPALAAQVVTLPSPGQLAEVNLKAGEAVTVQMPKATGCVYLGVYERSGSIGTARVEMTGGGHQRSGYVRLTQLFGKMGSAVVTAKDATNGFHIVYKETLGAQPQRTCERQSATQRAYP